MNRNISHHQISDTNPAIEFSVCDNLGVKSLQLLTILGQSTRNLIIEGVMLNHDTLWKNISFVSSKDVKTIKNQIYLKSNFMKSHKYFSIWFGENNYRFPPFLPAPLKETLAGRREWSDNQW